MNLVYKYMDMIDAFCLWNADGVEKFCAVYLKKSAQESRDKGKPASILKPAAQRYNGIPDDARYRVRDAVRGFNRCYSKVVQIAQMFDRDLHKFYLFSEYLQRLIPNEPRGIIGIKKKIQLDKNALTERSPAPSGCRPSRRKRSSNLKAPAKP